MTDDQARRDEVAAVLARALDVSDIVTTVPLEDHLADALLASDVLARIEREAKAEALSHVEDAFERGHELGVREGRIEVKKRAEKFCAENHTEDEVGAHVVYVWELRAALDEPTGEA